MSDDRQTDSDYPQSKAEKRRDDLLKRLLQTPPKQRPKRERPPRTDDDRGENSTEGDRSLNKGNHTK